MDRKKLKKTIICPQCKIECEFVELIKKRFAECPECSSEFYLDINTNKITSKLFKKSYCTGPNGCCGAPCLIQQNDDGSWPEHGYCGGDQCFAD